MVIACPQRVYHLSREKKQVAYIGPCIVDLATRASIRYCPLLSSNYEFPDREKCENIFTKQPAYIISLRSLVNLLSIQKIHV